MALAKQTDGFISHSPNESNFSAIVTMANNIEIRVEKIQLQETPGGLWISAPPNRYVSELYLPDNQGQRNDSAHCAFHRNCQH